MDLGSFVAKYRPREMARAAANADELRLLDGVNGVQDLATRSAHRIQDGRRQVPQRSGDPGCYLWVVIPTRIPFIFERETVIPPLQSGAVKHSNLTGGQPASCGGEVWFDPADEDQIYVNGCSGRYGPKSSDELDDVVAVYQGTGYRVTSFGWDNEAHKPAMVLRR